MSMHNAHEPQEIGASKGFEPTDVHVSGVVRFLVALGIFAVATAGIAYLLGKTLNARMAKEDGSPRKWAQPVDVRTLGNMPNDPDLKSKMAELTQRFPTPRVQTDDGNQDVADLHAREELLLDNYSWIDNSQGKVRIPIERAMDLIAQRGLPVASVAEQLPLMTGDKKPVIAVPLTNGFAPTSYELDQAANHRVEARRPEPQK